MTNKQKQAMIKRKKAEAEQSKTTEVVVSEELQETDTEISTILDGVDFDISYCNDQETITNKILYLADQEKEILSQFKDKDDILASSIYKELYKTIVDVFGYYLAILRSRLELIIKSAKLQAINDRMQFKVGELKRDKINNKFQVKILRYKNWLYYWKKWRQHKIDRKLAKEKYKAEIKVLKNGVVMSP